MTFGVPYSFVPGTKAKADEVNANFIDVLTKIEDTNSRIDETNSNADTKSAEISAKFDEVSEALEQKSDLDLSNLSSSGQAKFDAKADLTVIDGKWVSKRVVLVNTATFSNTDSVTYSLSSYLPNDGNLYQIKFFVAGNTSKLGQYNYSTGLGSEQLFFVSGNNFSSNVLAIVNSTRKLTVSPTSICSGTNQFSITLVAYRKVR